MAAFQQLQPRSSSGRTYADIARAVTATAGLDLYQHNFTLGSGSSGGSSRRCSTLHAVVRAPRGDGSEGFVLMLPLDTSTNPRAASLAAAAGVSIAGHLQRSRWLAKDAVLLFTDAACGAQASAQVG